MKKLLIGLFLVSSALAFSQRVVKGSQAYDEKGVVYIQGEKTPYTGVLQNINEKGVLVSEAEYKDGKVVLYPYEKKRRPQIVNSLKAKTTQTKATLKSKI